MFLVMFYAYFIKTNITDILHFWINSMTSNMCRPTFYRPHLNLFYSSTTFPTFWHYFSYFKCLYGSFDVGLSNEHVCIVSWYQLHRPTIEFFRVIRNTAQWLCRFQLHRCNGHNQKHYSSSIASVIIILTCGQNRINNYYYSFDFHLRHAAHSVDTTGSAVV